MMQSLGEVGAHGLADGDGTNPKAETMDRHVATPQSYLAVARRWPVALVCKQTLTNRLSLLLPCLPVVFAVH